MNGTTAAKLIAEWHIAQFCVPYLTMHNLLRKNTQGLLKPISE